MVKKLKSSYTTEAIKEIRRKLINEQLQNWLHNSYLHWKWWLLIILFILPWLIWWKFADKRKLNLILLYGLIVLIFNAFLDDLGSGLLWWFYPIRMIPTLNVLLSPSVSIVPCLMMVIFQCCHTWKSFLIFNFILSLVFCFLGEPLFIALGIYELVTWKLFYSFLHYNISGMIARWITLKINKFSVENI